MYTLNDPREIATVLAALRLRQRKGWSSDPEQVIATDGGTLEPLTDEEIDDLCERINLGEAEPVKKTRTVPMRKECTCEDWSQPCTCGAS